MRPPSGKLINCKCYLRFKRWLTVISVEQTRVIHWMIGGPLENVYHIMVRCVRQSYASWELTQRHLRISLSMTFCGSTISRCRCSPGEWLACYAQVRSSILCPLRTHTKVRPRIRISLSTTFCRRRILGRSWWSGQRLMLRGGAFSNLILGENYGRELAQKHFRIHLSRASLWHLASLQVLNIERWAGSHNHSWHRSSIALAATA